MNVNANAVVAALQAGGAVAIFLALVVGLWVMVTYNRLVANRNHCREAWSNVDTELERRHDLIPQLVSTVKGYAAHERALLAEIVQLRERGRASLDPTADYARNEGQLSQAVDRLFALAEAYPDLKADRNFLQLQNELVITADRIQAATRFYNGNVRALNNRVLQFPSSLVARRAGLTVLGYFEASPGARSPSGFTL